MHRRRAARLSSLLVAGLAMAVAIGFGARASTAQGAATAEPSIGVIRLCPGCAGVGDHSRYQYVLLNAGDYAQIPTLKAKNPGIKVLVYKDMSSTRSWSCGGLIAAGVDYCFADKYHPEWFTHKDGQRFQWNGYPDHWQMNVGLAAYQDQWAANVLAELRDKGWDGVVIDNANIDPSGYAPLPYDEYPTQASYQAATRSFLANVGPKLRGQGFLVIPNIQHHGSLLTESLWKDWIQFTSGGHLEHYTKWGSDTSGQIAGSGWETSGQAFVKATEQAGKIFLGTFSAPKSDTRSLRYARGSFLLDWDGGPSALTFEPNPLDTDPWSDEWTVDVGTPLGLRYAVGGAWRRDFTGGTVVVNPSASQQPVSLGGTYLMPDGTAVSAVTLDPASAVILRTPAAPPPAPPPSPPPTVTPPVNQSLPTITVQGDRRTLVGTTGTWSGTSIVYAYQWQRCNVAVTSCTAISTATSSSYRLTWADRGSRIRLQVTASNAGGSAQALSQPTGVVSSAGKL